MKRLDQHKQLTGMACTLLVVLIMVGLAEGLQEKEIIFPEMTALAIGTLLAPKLSWQVSRSKMIGLISICSLLGWGISSMLPLPVGVKILLGFAVAQWLLIHSRTSFAPCISAMVLPILMGTKSFVYPVSATGLTLLLLGIEAAYHYLTQTERTAYVTLHFSKCYLPPAGALTILPMMIPEASLMAYPFLVLIGTSCLMGSALIFFKEKKSQEEDKSLLEEQCA